MRLWNWFPKKRKLTKKRAIKKRRKVKEIETNLGFKYIDLFGKNYYIEVKLIGNRRLDLKEIFLVEKNAAERLDKFLSKKVKKELTVRYKFNNPRTKKEEKFIAIITGQHLTKKVIISEGTLYTGILHKLKQWKK